MWQGVHDGALNPGNFWWRPWQSRSGMWGRSQVPLVLSLLQVVCPGSSGDRLTGAAPIVVTSCSQPDGEKTLARSSETLEGPNAGAGLHTRLLLT